MQKFRLEKYDENANGGKERQVMLQIAMDCLQKLQAYDIPEVDEDTTYDQWLDMFDPDNAVFPDRLYEEIVWFTDETTSSSIYRVRRSRAFRGRPSDAACTTEDAGRVESTLSQASPNSTDKEPATEFMEKEPS